VNSQCSSVVQHRKNINEKRSRLRGTRVELGVLGSRVSIRSRRIRRIDTAQPVLYDQSSGETFIMSPGNQTNTGLPETIQPVRDSNPKRVAELILGAALFQDLHPEDIAVLAKYLSLHDVKPGTVVFQEGDTSDFMGLIVEGAVELFKENPTSQAVKIGSECAGRLLGEMALMDGEPRSATARFTESGQVLILTRENFNRLLHEHPRAAANFLFRLSRLLSRRLRKTTGQLTSFLPRS
jgi:CRP/FNR family transcriptional regulator, cyclic AMP receptor protein